MREEIIGGQRLILGDCREVLPGLEAGSVILTDAPYGIKYDTASAGHVGNQQYAALAGDDAPQDVSPLLRFADALCFMDPCNTVGLPLGEGVFYAWDKVTRNGMKVRIAECEYAWHRRGTKPRIFRHLWSGAYRASEAGQRSEHPTQKPIALMQWCIQWMNATAQIIDPFMGSGTTLVAAELLGRSGIGIELKPEYFDMACRRVEEAVRKREQDTAQLTLTA